MAAQPITFSFTVDTVSILQTRSKHKDTDFVSSTLQLLHADGSKEPSQNISKSIGDLGTGGHSIVLTFPNILISPGQTVKWNYSIVNAGNAPPSKVIAGLENLGTQILSTEIKGVVIGAAAAGSILGIVGSVVAGGVALVASALEGLLTANCDGLVASEQVIFTYDQLVDMTATTNRYLNTTRHPGLNSPAGCGENSNYNVNWHIDKGPYTPWGGASEPAGNLGHGPPVHQR